MQPQSDVTDRRPRRRWLGAIRVAETATATLLLGIGLVTIAGHATQAMAGTALVFSQDDMGDPQDAVGPAPVQGGPEASPQQSPPETTVGSTQYVDLVSIGLTLVGGLTAGAGAVMLHRRSRWSVPLGMAGMVVAGVVGAVPAIVGVWAASYYGMASPGQLVPYLGISAVLVGLALAGLAMIWRHRAAIAPA